MDRTFANSAHSLSVTADESSPPAPQPSNAGLSLLERIDRVLGKKRALPTNRGKRKL